MEEILATRTDWETIDQATRAAAVRGEAAIHEVMLRANDGRNVWCQLTSRRVGDGAASVLVLTDITSLKRREELAWHQANHDDLTGLPNRRQLSEHARRLLSVALQKRRLAAVLVLDLDGFKEINDLFGHSYGDNLLKRVALRLSGVLRDYDVVARTGGDEFVVLLPEIEQPSIAMVVAEKLIAAASENVENLGRSLRLHASVGVALFPSDGQDFETLLAAADGAMYAAKAAGKNRYQLAGEVIARRRDESARQSACRRRRTCHNPFGLTFSRPTAGNCPGFGAAGSILAVRPGLGPRMPRLLGASDRNEDLDSGTQRTGEGAGSSRVARAPLRSAHCVSGRTAAAAGAAAGRPGRGRGCHAAAGSPPLVWAWFALYAVNSAARYLLATTYGDARRADRCRYSLRAAVSCLCRCRNRCSGERCSRSCRSRWRS